MLTAGYILWMVQRCLFGPPLERFKDLKDASFTEMVPVATLVIAVLVVGIYSAVIVDVFAEGVGPIIDSVQRVA